MNISETFIKRPIATTLMMLAIALFGMVAYRSLAVSDLPNVDFPTLLVTASLPGASPENMASAVATPLENQFSMIAGLNGMTSSNSLGSTQITLEFDLSRHLDVLAKDGLVKIDKAFVANRPQTTCRVTALGRKRFREYLTQLERVLRDAHAEEPAAKPDHGTGWAPA